MPSQYIPSNLKMYTLFTSQGQMTVQFFEQLFEDSMSEYTDDIKSVPEHF